MAAPRAAAKKAKPKPVPHGDSITDPRFARIQTDPLFRLPAKHATHAALDARFAHMLHDERFSSKAAVDRYGRRLHSSKTQRIQPSDTKRKSRKSNALRNPETQDAAPVSELERLYHVPRQSPKRKSGNSKDDSDGSSGSSNSKRESDSESDSEASSASRESIDQDETVQRELARLDKSDHPEPYDPARQGGYSASSSSEDSTSESDAESDEDLDALEYPDRQGDDIPTGEVTARLAVVNLDWDNIRAADLLAVFSSFVPSHGSIVRVDIYPSDFGKERMEREELEGPPSAIFASRKNGTSKDSNIVSKRTESRADTSAMQRDNADSVSDDDQDEDEAQIRKELLAENEGQDFDSTQLRRYQLERLRYYYAVLACSSRECAEAIYHAVDGLEYLATANFFDLRFIPDDMDFTTDKPRDSCSRLPDRYRPNEFVTDALQHSKVKLTWDDDDRERKEVQRRAFAGNRADMEENDLKAYLGTDSSDGAGDLEDPDVTSPQAQPLSKKVAERQRMRALLGLSAESSTDAKHGAQQSTGGMEVTFSSGLTDPTSNGKSEAPSMEETTIEKYVRKEREKKAQRRNEAKARRENAHPGDDDDLSHVESESEARAEDDLGFDDPFFMDPEADAQAAKKAHKTAKKKSKAPSQDEDEADFAQRAELEELMQDDQETDIRHFDANQLEKGAKALRRRQYRKVRLSKAQSAAIEAKQKDHFQVQVDDPRFQAIHSRSEFALDPSHPKFKRTEGMEALLAETRRKRAGRQFEDLPEGRPKKSSRR